MGVEWHGSNRRMCARVASRVPQKPMLFLVLMHGRGAEGFRFKAAADTKGLCADGTIRCVEAACKTRKGCES